MTNNPIGADALLRALELQNTKQMWAYPGGAVLPIYDRMPDYGIHRVLTRHEQAAAFAAQGYSRSTREVGVCLATSGPGATNLVTGIADAMLDNVPMVAITGNVFAHLIGTDAFQEVDIVGVCEPIVKHSYFVESADDIPRIIQEAFYLARSGRPGPVLIDIPKSTQVEPVSSEVWEKLNKGESFAFNLPGYDTAPALDMGQIEKTIEALGESESPIAILGHGAVLSEAESVVRELLEKHQIPYVWTLHGIGAMPTDHELALGMLGMHGTAAANYAVHHSDLILGIGIRFDDRIYGKITEFHRKAQIIHFDIDPAEFGKNVKTYACVQGQISETVSILSDSIRDRVFDFSSWTKTLSEKKLQWPLDPNKSGKLTEISVLNQLFEVLDEDSIVTVDVGQHEMWAAQRFPAVKSRKFLASGGLGTMGFSLPAAMGAVVSGHETWSISGDGGFQMNIQELATIVQENIPVKIVILNNSFLGMVRQWQELFYAKNYVDTPMVNPDFQKVGEAYGIPSYKVSTQVEADAMIEKMKNHTTGPILCEFVVEREENVFPMVPAGESLGATLIDPVTKID